MSPTRYTQHPEVLKLIDDLRGRGPERIYSDLVDDGGHQYVDLVMEGRGVLGLALVGYVHVLEQAGLRFRRIGGTSAGTIMALLLVGLGPPEQAKGDRLIRILADKNVWDFVDGDYRARKFVRTVMSDDSTLTKVWRGLQVIGHFRNHWGLNRGKHVEEWLGAILREHGIADYGQLRRRLERTAPGLRHRDGVSLPPHRLQSDLMMVAAEVTTETKVILPRMAPLYWSNPDSVNPAVFARASMSIPLFFRPLKVKNIPQGPAAERLWRDMAGYHGSLPARCIFVDGGVMSNLPINQFHRSGIPSAPTFGVQLGVDRTSPGRVDGLFQYLDAIFKSARHTLDFDFILRNPDYRRLVTAVPTDPYHWLDFRVSPAGKLDLFLRGARAAHAFLKGFDWEGYKGLRRFLAGGSGPVAGGEPEGHDAPEV